LKVGLSCAVPPNRIADVWITDVRITDVRITDQNGHTVLNGYADRTLG
jgi:hypothetical protein